MSTTTPVSAELAEEITARQTAARRSRRGAVIARYVGLVLVFFVMVGPFLWQLSTSLKGPGVDLYSQPPELLPREPSLQAYFDVVDVVPIFTYIANSLIVVAIVVLGNIIGATAAGYALAKMRFRGKKIAMGVFLVGILVPAEVIIIAKYLLAESMGLNDTLLGVALPTAVAALNVLLMRNAIAAIPESLEEAAMIDGANAWVRFRRVVLPSITGTTAVVAIFAFVGAWDEFLWPLIVLSDQSKYTLTVGLNYLQGTFANDPRVVAAGTIIAVVPLIIMFFALQRYFFRGVGEGAIKG